MLDENTVSSVDTSSSETSDGPGTLVGETEETTAKRTRTSPIAKSFDRVDACLAARIDALVAQNDENEDPELDLTSMIELLSDVRTEVATLRHPLPVAAPAVEGAPRRGRPKGSKNKPKDGSVAASAPKSAGAWYVGVAPTGERSAVKVASVPSATSHAQFATVYGPFVTKRGAEYRAAKSDTELVAALVEMPVVFGARKQ